MLMKRLFIIFSVFRPTEIFFSNSDFSANENEYYLIHFLPEYNPANINDIGGCSTGRYAPGKLCALDFENFDW